MVLFLVVLLCSNVACWASEPPAENRLYNLVDKFTRNLEDKFTCTAKWFNQIYQQWEEEDIGQQEIEKEEQPKLQNVDWENGFATGETRIKPTETEIVVKEKSPKTTWSFPGIAVKTQSTLLDPNQNAVRKIALMSFANRLRHVQLSLMTKELLKYKTRSVFFSEEHCFYDEKQGIGVSLLPPHIIANLQSLTVEYSDGVMIELQRVPGCTELWESQYWKK